MKYILLALLLLSSCNYRTNNILTKPKKINARTFEKTTVKPNTSNVIYEVANSSNIKPQYRVAEPEEEKPDYEPKKYSDGRMRSSCEFQCPL